jgi:hypothetical protein
VWIFLFLVRRRDPDPDAWQAGLILAAEPQGPATARASGVAVRPTSSRVRPAVVQPATPREPQVFTTPPSKDAERVKVGYRRVRVSSKPDAVRSVELGRLERGDEVEILESYEGFLRIQTPDGIVGWIQRHTVGGSRD